MAEYDPEQLDQTLRFAALGKLAAICSLLEDVIARFTSLLMNCGESKIAEHFSYAEGLRRRIGHLHWLVKFWASRSAVNPELLLKVDGLIGRVANLAEERNHYLHGRLGFAEDIGDLGFIKKGKGKKATPAHIDAIAVEAFEVLKELTLTLKEFTIATGIPWPTVEA